MGRIDNKKKIERTMSWFIVLSLVLYFADPEIQFLSTKIILPITGLFLIHKLFNNNN